MRPVTVDGIGRTRRRGSRAAADVGVLGHSRDELGDGRIFRGMAGILRRHDLPQAYSSLVSESRGFIVLEQ